MRQFIRVCTAIGSFATALWAIPRIISAWIAFSRFSVIVNEIYRQFQPNGGTSLVDRVHKLELRLNRIDETLTEIRNHVKSDE